MRDRLIELVETAKCEWKDKVLAKEKVEYLAEYIADHLLAAGIVVPPCKVGDTVYHLTSEEVLDVLNCAEIYEGKVFSMAKDEDGVWLYCRYDNGLNYWYAERDIGKSLFLTREEAEKALAERSESDG